MITIEGATSYFDNYIRNFEKTSYQVLKLTNNELKAEGEYVTDWLNQYSKANTKRNYEKNFKIFLDWIDMTDRDLVKAYKEDREEFADTYGKKVLEFFNYLVNDYQRLKKGKNGQYIPTGEIGLSVNSARQMANTIRAFFTVICTPVKMRRRSLPKAQEKIGSHEFIPEELQSMFNVGNLEDKARLTTALSLGYGVKMFSNVKWENIEGLLSDKLEAPVSFINIREKSGSEVYSHLSGDAIECLREKRKLEPENEYVFTSNHGSKPLTQQALNQWLKVLCKKANIIPRGDIHFHLMRKYLFNSLINSGLSEVNAKLMTGKSSIEGSVNTYIQINKSVLNQGFKRAHTMFFSLSGITNGNSKKTKAMEGELTELHMVTTALAKTIAQFSEENQKQNREIEKLKLEIKGKHSTIETKRGTNLNLRTRVNSLEHDLKIAKKKIEVLEKRVPNKED